MREFQIILPCPKGLRHRRKRDTFETALVAFYGGFTRTTGSGAWRNGSGTAEREFVDIYTVATDGVQKSSVQLLAHEAAREFDQTAIYVRHTDGDVELVAA